MHLSRHIAQKPLEIRQDSCTAFAQSDEKSDGVICTSDLIRASLTLSYLTIKLFSCKITMYIVAANVAERTRHEIYLGRSENYRGSRHQQELFQAPDTSEKSDFQRSAADIFRLYKPAQLY